MNNRALLLSIVVSLACINNYASDNGKPTLMIMIPKGPSDEVPDVITKKETELYAKYNQLVQWDRADTKGYQKVQKECRYLHLEHTRLVYYYNYLRDNGL